MNSFTAQVGDLRPRPRTPSPAGSAATEDEGQRYWEDMSVSEMSDKYPAGRLPFVPESDPDTHGSAGRDRSEVRTEDPALIAVQRPDSQVSTGRGVASQGMPAEAPKGARISRRREVSLDVRLTVADREAIRRRARVLGIRPSAWGRAVMLDALDSRSAKVKTLENVAVERDEKFVPLAPMVEQLRRVGVNLNQALRRGVAVDEDLLQSVLVVVDEVRALLGDRTRI